MNNKLLILIPVAIIVLIFGAFLVLGSSDKEEISEQVNYEDITSQDLNSILSEREVFLLDVHVPEQVHITGTDAFIDYTKIEENQSKLPTDKDSEIVVYCRSGSMSKTASETLVELGYTNVKNLAGGINSWKDAGYEIDESSLGTF